MLALLLEYNGISSLNSSDAISSLHILEIQLRAKLVLSGSTPRSLRSFLKIFGTRLRNSVFLPSLKTRGAIT